MGKSREEASPKNEKVQACTVTVLAPERQPRFGRPRKRNLGWALGATEAGEPPLLGFNAEGVVVLSSKGIAHSALVPHLTGCPSPVHRAGCGRGARSFQAPHLLPHKGPLQCSFFLYFYSLPLSLTWLSILVPFPEVSESLLFVLGESRAQTPDKQGGWVRGPNHLKAGACLHKERLALEPSGRGWAGLSGEGCGEAVLAQPDPRSRTARRAPGS